MELVNLRVRATAQASKLRLSDFAPRLADKVEGQTARRDAYFGPVHGTQRARVLGRVDIQLERACPGPLIVEEPDSTTVVPPGWSVRRDAQGNLILEAGQAAESSSTLSGIIN